MSPRSTRPPEPTPAGNERRTPRRWWRRLPRTETVLLLIAFVWTAGAKFLIIRKQLPDDLITRVTEAVLSDVVFFAAMWLGFSLLHLLRRPGLAGRLTLVVAALTLSWTMANAAWLLATHVQLQPGVLLVLLGDPTEFWPTVESHLVARPTLSVPLLVTIAACAAWLLFRLIRPAPMTRTVRALLAWSAASLAVLALASLAHWTNVRTGRLAYSGEVLGFSSHWYAVVWAVKEASTDDDADTTAIDLPRVGERPIRWDAPPPEDPPNVVVVFLESVSWSSTSLGDGGHETTPFLAALGAEGVRFVTTRVPVAQTTKAWWVGLTGCLPDLEPDFVESVLVERPYESLASILAERGYRSAFFEMSRGSFECAPGLFTNLAFDWAWFRENLEDESAHLGYMNGDDHRMLDPTFEWVDGDDRPFLLTMISSVSHDPYVLPDWYEHEPAADTFGRYLETVRFTDGWLEELCARLRRRGLLENTLLCVIGDHGDAFRPEGGLGRWTPFEEVIRVPWVIRFPGRVEAGRLVEWPCSQLDVTPTILSLLGADVESAGFDGRDALRPGAPDRRMYFSTWYDQSPLGYVEGSRKLVYWPYTDTLFEYDLATDPAEKRPRTIPEGPERTRIIDDVQRWRKSSMLLIPARRFRESVTYEHWRTVSSGRYAWAYYRP